MVGVVPLREVEGLHRRRHRSDSSSSDSSNNSRDERLRRRIQKRGDELMEEHIEVLQEAVGTHDPRTVWAFKAHSASLMGQLDHMRDLWRCRRQEALAEFITSLFGTASGADSDAAGDAHGEQTPGMSREAEARVKAAGAVAKKKPTAAVTP